MYEQISMPDPNAPSRKIDGITHRAIDKKQVAEHLGLSPTASTEQILAEVAKRTQEHHGDFLWPEEFEAALGIDPSTLVSPGATPETARMTRINAVDGKLANMLGDDKTIVRLSRNGEELTGSAKAGAAFQKQFDEAPPNGDWQLTALHAESRNHDIAKGRTPVLLTADVPKKLEPFTCTAIEKVEILSALQKVASLPPDLGRRIQAINARIAAVEQTVAAVQLLTLRADLDGIRKGLGMRSRVGLTGLDLYSASIEDQIAANPESAIAHDDAMIQRRHAERAAADEEKLMASQQGFYNSR